MNLYPKKYLNNIREVSIQMLQENNITGVILDVDNTLINYYKQFEQGTTEWVHNLKENGIKFCIVSNSNKKQKVKQVADELGIPYCYFAMKPLKRGFRKAKKILNLEYKSIAAIGDQIMTDVIGANRCGIFSILVKPIEGKDILITKIKRPLEKKIINTYLEKVEKEKV